MSFDVAALGAMQLVDPEGSEQTLGDRWATDPRVILFLRHFG
jgi:hypothetical protein